MLRSCSKGLRKPEANGLRWNVPPPHRRQRNKKGIEMLLKHMVESSKTEADATIFRLAALEKVAECTGKHFVRPVRPEFLHQVMINHR